MASLCLSKPSITLLISLAVALLVSHNLLTIVVGEDGCGCDDHGVGGSHESAPPPPPLPPLYYSPPNNNPPPYPPYDMNYPPTPPSPYPPCDNDKFPPLLPLYPYGPFQGCSDLSSGSRLDPRDHVLVFGCMILVTLVLFFWGHDYEPSNLY